MYRDAQEELKRLEEALLREDEQPEEHTNEWNIDIDDAISDIPDLPQKDNRGKIIFGLTVAVIALTAVIAGLLIYVLISYKGDFL